MSPERERVKQLGAFGLAALARLLADPLLTVESRPARRIQNKNCGIVMQNWCSADSVNL